MKRRSSEPHSQLRFLILWTSIPFTVHLLPGFSNFCPSYWWFFCLKWLPSRAPKCHLISYIQEGGDEPNGVLDELHSSMNFRAITTSSMLRNQQYISSKVSLDRNTHKTVRYWSLMKMLRAEAAGTWPLISPHGQLFTIHSFRVHCSFIECNYHE